MTYRLSINNEEKFVRFDLSGKLTESEIDSAIADLQRIREKQKLNCVLCNQYDLEVPPNDLVGFFTAKRLSSGSFVGIKLAIVRSDTTKERLFEIAASNRGAIVKVFDDEEKAIHWLHNN